MIIFIHDLKQESHQESIALLQNYAPRLFQINKKAQFYTFYHQCDLDFIYQGSKIDETKNVFFAKFKKFLEQNFQNSSQMLNRYSEKVTSIYDESINLALSQVISSEVASCCPDLPKFMTEVTKSLGAKNIVLWDRTTRLYILKDEIPIDKQEFSLCLQYICMFNKFSDLFGELKEQESAGPEQSEVSISQ